MPIAMMGFLEAQCASLGQQVRELAVENARGRNENELVRKLLTESARRDEKLLAEIAQIRHALDWVKQNGTLAHRSNIMQVVNDALQAKP